MEGNIVLGKMIPVVLSRSKSLGSLVFSRLWSSSVTTEESGKWKNKKGLLISFPLSFSFMRGMCFEEERASMEVRGDDGRKGK